jgi:putative nucleotidyltransferase with HDIG domain
VIYNELETSRRIVQAEAEVSPIKGQVLEGEKIIEKGYRIRGEDLEKYHVLKEESLAREPGMTTYNSLITFIGTFLVNAFLLLIFGFYLYFYRKQLYKSFSSLLVFSIIFMIVMAFAALIARIPAIPTILIPISLASLLIAILHDVRIAVVAILVISILIGGQESFGYDVLFISLLGGISGGLSIRIVRRRRQLGESILFIAGGYILAILSINMIKLTPWIEVVELCGWGGINAVISTLVAMALLPVFEFFFNETTDLSLLELSDFNHPLLKSLVIRAPGTWAHTLAVSSLAEGAAEAIGANSLLARVGCYYHDVGKIKKPEYFVENQSSGINPHDNISPKMSAMIIHNHVKEGIELAREANLPQRIIDFIPEHHGTTKISFFYEKAKEQGSETSVNIHDYSHNGPKPKSKETAICMFADSVESMSRLLEDPSPRRIRGMVETAVRSKIEAEQLENCDLTFKDIHLIEEEFIKVLLARFHSRIEYLKEEGNEKTDEEKNNVPDSPRKSGKTNNTDEKRKGDKGGQRSPGE